MTLHQFSRLFNRAFIHSFSKQKFFLLFATLSLVAMIFILCREAASSCELWLRESLTFFPLILSVGAIMAAGVVLTKCYHYEKEGNRVPLHRCFMESLDRMLKVFVVALPLTVLFLAMWVMLAIFHLLGTVPLIGSMLSFAPFMLNVMILALAVGATLICFYLVPFYALGQQKLRRFVYSRVRQDLFLNLLFYLVGSLVVFVIFRLLISALPSVGEKGFIEGVIDGLFVMIPFVALLTPFVNFFFNFALEAHQYFDRQELRS